MFQALDVNGDGSISLEELKEGLAEKENGETLYNMLKAADTDNSGEIDYTEFIAATLDAQTYMRNDYLRSAFDIFDVDGSGKIDAEEIVRILGSEDVKMENLPNLETIQKYIKDNDQDGDGEIDFNEFCEMMHKCDTGEI
jgi:calcium-dependent protein kinase